VEHQTRTQTVMTTLRTVVFDTKPYERESLQRAGTKDKVEWHFVDWRLSAETASAAQGARAVCIFVNDRADRACLEALASNGVKHIALRCAGYNGVDIEAATEIGLSITRVPAYSPYAVAEHAVGLLLALNRKIPRASNRVRDLNFSLNGLVGFDLHGKTAGVFGTGKIGRVAAQILRGFGMKVLAFDLFPSAEWATEHGVVYTDARALARESEVISLHVPLTTATRHLVDGGRLAQMKRGAILVNSARGGVVDEEALAAALRLGHLGGAALDVFEREPLDAGSLLADCPNLLLTPHIAGVTVESNVRVSMLVAEKVAEALRRRHPID